MRIPQTSNFSGPRQEENSHPGTIARAIQAVDTGNRPTSIYLHCPFCFHKCHYCDFYSIVAEPEKQIAFTRRLEAEIRVLGPLAGKQIETIFIGGGTPTLLAADLWVGLLGTLRDTFKISDETEFTVEANPETLSPELAEILAQGGVNRISIGAQSFFPKHLTTLERWHEPASVARAVAAARGAGISRISLDLIFGIPGQTVSEWAADLDEVLALDPEHLSCYALTFEPGTPLTVRREQGTIQSIDEDVETEMFQLTRTHLGRAGFEAYEISNFARPGAACRHNLVYWRNGDWLAAGPSAAGHFAGHRWKNKAHLGEYLNSEGFAPIGEYELPDAKTRYGDRLLMGLRLAEGLPLGETMAEAEAIGAGASFAATVESLINRGFVERDTTRLRLTETGVLFSNTAIGELINTTGK